MKKIILAILTMLTVVCVFAQKQTFDIITYTPPKGWTEKQDGNYMSYSKIDGGSWAQMVIYKQTISQGNMQVDFDKEWTDIVTPGKTISSPEKTEPKTEDGWTVMSGSGTWGYNGATVATLLTVYSNNKVVVSVLCNATARPYFKDYQTLISSLNIDAPSVTENSGTENTAEAPGANNTNSIVGAWINNISEDRGFINGYRMYTGGYMKKEYVFKEDGSYIFRQKDWLASRDDIYFVYETGKWVVNGNQLTITPEKGKAGWWNKDKIGNRTDKWGAYQKAAKYNLEKTTYTFEFQISDYGRFLLLNYSMATERDGDHPADNGQHTSYHFDTGKSIIDNPPGL